MPCRFYSVIYAASGKSHQLCLLRSTGRLLSSDRGRPASVGISSCLPLDQQLCLFVSLSLSPYPACFSSSCSVWTTTKFLTPVISSDCNCIAIMDEEMDTFLEIRSTVSGNLSQRLLLETSHNVLNHVHYIQNQNTNKKTQNVIPNCKHDDYLYFSEITDIKNRNCWRCSNTAVDVTYIFKNK